MPGTKAVTVLVSAGVGSRHEAADEHGLAHFLEHMFFKGSKRFSTTRELATYLDSLGADYNAFTSKEITAFYVKAASIHFEKIILVLSSLLLEPTFPESEFERERQVVIEEWKGLHDDPARLIDEHLEAEIYRNSGLEHKVIGERVSIKGLTREKLIRFVEKYYRAENIVLAVAGDLPAQAEEKIEAIFDFRSGGSSSNRESPPIRPDLPKVRLHKRETAQSHLALGFKGFEYDNKLRFAYRLLSVMLGGTMSSRLFIEIRERKGLCYYIYSSAESYSDTGAFVIKAGVSDQKAGRALRLIIDEVKKLRDLGPTDEELKRAKDHSLGKLFLRLEDSESVASFLSDQALISKEILDRDQLGERIAKVTRDEIQAVSKALFQPNNLVVAVIGQFSGPKIFQDSLVAF